MNNKNRSRLCCRLSLKNTLFRMNMSWEKIDEKKNKKLKI